MVNSRADAERLAPKDGQGIGEVPPDFTRRRRGLACRGEAAAFALPPAAGKKAKGSRNANLAKSRLARDPEATRRVTELVKWSAGRTDCLRTSKVRC
jgi:hypothetical protein